jgi:hypothetical protein
MRAARVSESVKVVKERHRFTWDYHTWVESLSPYVAAAMVDESSSNLRVFQKAKSFSQFYIFIFYQCMMMVISSISFRK